jgi:hypothetical protein
MNSSRSAHAAPYTVALYPHLQRTIYALLVLFPLMMWFFYWYLTRNGATLDSGRVFYPLLMTATGLFGSLLYYWIILANTVTIDPSQRKVFLNTRFGRITKMTFDEVGAIDVFTNDTTKVCYYALYKKSNLHSKKPLSISPPFPDTTQGRLLRQMFEENELPIIKSLLYAAHSAKPRQEELITESNLRFYAYNDGAYYQRNIAFQSLSDFFYIPICFCIAILGLSWGYEHEFLRYIGISFGLMGLFLLYGKTEKRYISQNQLTREFIGGLQRKTYSNRAFVNYHITHNSTNLIYTTTDVMAQFGNEMVHLYKTRKTANIERLLNETTYLLNR